MTGLIRTMEMVGTIQITGQNRLNRTIQIIPTKNTKIYLFRMAIVGATPGITPTIAPNYDPIATTSAKTPAAVTAAPAPGPRTTKGRSAYRSVVNTTILSLPERV